METSLQKFSEGAGHIVYVDPGDDEYLIKLPKSNEFSYQRVCEDVRLARERFGKWLPETIVEPGTPYRIRQARVPRAENLKAKHLQCKNIRSQVAELLRANTDSLAEDGTGLDFMGLEGSVKTALFNAEKHRGKRIERWAIRPFFRFLDWLKSIYPRFPALPNMLELWDQGGSQPEIANVVLDAGAEKIYVVDASLIHLHDPSLKQRGRARFLQWWNRQLLRRFFSLKL